MEQALRERRRQLERIWSDGVSGAGEGAGAGRPDVVASWLRSAAAIGPEVREAPVGSPDDVAQRWAVSRLGRASRVILDDLRTLAADGDLMVALTDETVTIAWAAGGPTMTRRADRVHFGPGGCWDEPAVGTNALALARHTARPSTVFSAEHYAPMVHDWVCYAAPILEPGTGRFLGVLDLSTRWDRAHPALMAAARSLARCVEHELAADGWDARPAPGHGPVVAERRSGLELRLLGPAEVDVDGVRTALSPRQLELLAVLSMCPDGLTLDEVTGRVYGDHHVSPSTVKAELSHLRHVLGDRIGSRPYRLTGAVHADVRHLLDAIAAGDVASAVEVYRGPLLVGSDSPDVEMWRRYLDAAVRDAVLRSGDADLLYALGGRMGQDVELQAAGVVALSQHDPRRSIATGRLAAADYG